MKNQFLKTLTLAVILLGLTTSPLCAQLGIKSVGSVQKKDGPMQVTVVFSEPMDPATAAAIGNYDLGAGVTINAASMMTGLPGLNEPGNGDPPLRGRVIDNQCVVLEVSGLGAATTTLTVSGIKSADLSQTLSTSTTFVPSGYSWCDIARIYTNSSNPGWVAPGRRAGKVVSDSDNGFDIFNNGRTGWAGEDEYTFVYKQVSGDFDFKSRMEFADYASRWSRAGIMVRERLDDGVPEGCQGRYLTAHADPPRSWTSNDAGEGAGTRAGQNSFESNGRLHDWSGRDTTTDPATGEPWNTSPGCGLGGNGLHTDFANDATGGGTGPGSPEYPLAWVRLERIGQTLRSSVSNDGQDWTVMRTIDFTIEGGGWPLPNTLYLGPAYCAEWGNINPLNVGARERYYMTQNRWGALTTPYVKLVTGSPMGFVATVQNLQTAFVPATLQMWLDDVSITATSVSAPDANGVITIVYTSPQILAVGQHTVRMQFNDNNIPPNLITKIATFDVSYVAVPEDYATTTFSGAKGTLMVSGHKMPDGVARGLGDNTTAATETQLQDGFIDPGTGQPYANNMPGGATPELLTVPFNFTMTPDYAGYFSGTNPPPEGTYWDNPMPLGIGSGLIYDSFSMQFYGYADLKVGAYTMIVNSDDGFKLSFGPNALDVIGTKVGEYNGGRAMTAGADPDPGFNFVITKAGVYPFRLTFSQGAGLSGNDASIEWYLKDAAGNRILVNDTPTAAVKTYPNGRGRAYLSKFLPYPGSAGVEPRPTLTFQTVDDLTAVTDSSVKVILDGTDISSSLAKVRAGGTLTMTWTPAADYPFESQHTGEFSYTESNGTSRTNGIDFTIKGFLPADLPASSFWIEIEDFDFNRGQYLAVADTAIGTDAVPYPGGAYVDPDVTPETRAVHSIDYWRTGVGPLNGTNTLGEWQIGGYVYRTDIPGWINQANAQPDYFVPLGGPKTDVTGVASTRPGGFTITTSYNTAWSGGGVWYNYTRTVPNGIYNAFLAGCHWNDTDGPVMGQIDVSLGKVMLGVGTSNQTVQALGTFYAAGNNTTDTLTPLKGSDGTLAAFKASGRTTFRITDRAGDINYFVLAPATGVAAKLTSASPSEGAWVPRDDTVRLTIEDFSTTVVLSSVKLYFDDVNVTAQATATKPADITTVAYDPAGSMPVGAHSYRLEFTDSAAKSFTNTFTFTAVALGVPNQFLIEAEDFNTGGGQTVAGASSMPYTGNAYNGSAAVFDTDYHSVETLTPQFDEPDDWWTAVYRSGAPITPGTEVPLNNNAGDALGRLRGATWQMTVNYKIGWTGVGDWCNYTRQIPAGYYEVYAALSHGDAPTSGTLMAAALDLVTGDVSQPDAQQVKARLGVFSAPATGGWGRNTLVPMTASAGGALQVISLAAPPTTLRFYPQNGDFDFFVLQPSSAAPAPTIGVATNPQGQPVLTFTGALYEAASVAGPYTKNATATSPFPVTGATSGNKFYRAGP